MKNILVYKAISAILLIGLSSPLFGNKHAETVPNKDYYIAIMGDSNFDRGYSGEPTLCFGFSYIGTDPCLVYAQSILSGFFGAKDGFSERYQINNYRIRFSVNGVDEIVEYGGGTLPFDSGYRYHLFYFDFRSNSYKNYIFFEYILEDLYNCTRNFYKKLNIGDDVIVYIQLPIYDLCSLKNGEAKISKYIESYPMYCRYIGDALEVLNVETCYIRYQFSDKSGQGFYLEEFRYTFENDENKIILKLREKSPPPQPALNPEQ
jgi:hypothetical protein